MVRRQEHEPSGVEASDGDERLGEAIETYLALVEGGHAPEPEVFAACHPEVGADLLAALEGLALVRGLVGAAEGTGKRLETGRRIAGYRIVRELGRGGMGVVYEAVHVGLDRPVALKVLGTHATPDSNGRRRFLNEARTAAGLHHTHIVPVFDVGQLGGLCYYAMQRIEGSGLDRVVRYLRRGRSTAAGGSNPGGSSFGRLGLAGRFGFTPRSGAGPAPFPVAGAGASPSEADGSSFGSASATGSWHAHPEGLGLEGTRGGGALTEAGAVASRRDGKDEAPPFEPPRGSAYYRWVAQVGRDAAEALGHAHERGVIHRDVKPSNLLVDRLGKVWVADFGLARRLADPSLTQHDSLLGTPRYMSPEQGRVGPTDGRSDLFSLGATLYELLTLRPPFEGRSAAELIDQIANREPAAPREFDPRVPRDLETIVLKLLSKRASDRYADAAALADDLGRFLRTEPVRARRISPWGRAWRFARRNPGVSVVSTAAVVAIAGVTAVAYVRMANDRDLAVQAQAKTQAAMRTQLYREASFVRLSKVPNFRATGLGLLHDSAALAPEPALRAKLRDEALEFLVARDAEARPGFATGKARAIAFTPDGSRLAALRSGEEGDSFALWDVARRGLVHESSLPADGGAGPPGAARGGGGRRPGRGPLGPLVAVVGPCLAVVGADGYGLRLFDAATGERRGDLALPGRRVLWVLATPDGRRLVTGDAFPSSRHGPPAPHAPPERFEVSLWDAERTDAPLATLYTVRVPEGGGPGGPPPFPLGALSPDGKTLAVARFRHSEVALWSTESGTTLGRIETQAELSALALGPDNQLATAGGGEVRLWDVAARASLPTLTPNQTAIRLLRFSPRGTLLAVVGFGGDVELWDTAAHAVVSVLRQPDAIEDVAFAPDGRTFAASGQSETTSAWGVVDPDVRSHLSGFDAVTRSMAFRADGLLALGSWKGTVRFWEAGRCVPSPAADLSASAEGREAGRGREPGRGREEPASRGEHPVSLVFDDRGRLVTLEPDALRVFPAPPQRGRGTSVALPKTPAGGMVRNAASLLAASQDGRTVAVVRPGQLLLWRSAEPGAFLTVPLPAVSADAGQAPRRGRFGGPPSFWRALALGPKGDRVYLVDQTGALRAWSLSGAAASLLPWPADPVDAMSLALSPDGAWLAVGDRAGRALLIDTATGKERARLEVPPGGEMAGPIFALAFAPDGREIAVGSQEGHIDLWSLGDKPARLVRLPGQRKLIAALAYAPNGGHLAAAASDRTVDVWDLGRAHERLARIGLDWVEPAAKP